MAERVAAKESLAAIDGDRFFELNTGGVEAAPQVVEIGDEERGMAGRAVFSELAVGREEDVELVVAAAVPDAIACGFREGVGPRHLLEAKDVLEEAAGFGGASGRDVYLNVVEAEDGHGGHYTQC